MTTHHAFSSKDLTKEPPRSPHMRLNGFAIVARTIDKCRADLHGKIGEYHFNCPLDKQFFGFMNIDADKFKAFVAEGKTDEEIVDWVVKNGSSKTEQEKTEWSSMVDKQYYHADPQKQEWFTSVCVPLGLDPVKTTLFEYLDVDDKTSFSIK